MIGTLPITGAQGKGKVEMASDSRVIHRAATQFHKNQQTGEHEATDHKRKVMRGTYTVTSQERRQQLSIAFISGACLGGLITAFGMLALG